MKQPVKRILIVFTGILLLFTICAVRVLGITVCNHSFAQTAAAQQTLQLTFSTGRGTIYDRNLQPLTGGKTSYMTAIVPSRKSAAVLSKVLPAQRMRKIYEQLKAGAPFLTNLDVPIESDDILCFPQAARYPKRTFAAHMLGYLDNSGSGVSGVEKAFNRTLSGSNVTTRITYAVDALRHQLPGETPKVETSPAGAQTGIVLTIDRNLQKLAEDSAANLQKGAAVILEAGTGKILASVSLPGYSPANVASALKKDDGALVNRVMQPYSVGSVFKLVSAAAALEHGADPNTQYNCTGSETVDGLSFHCAGGEKHGRITMREAIADSCNCYFIHLMQFVPQAQFLSMAHNLGFGQSDELAPGFISSSGSLPTLSELENRKALANFSFGQGNLTATPLQIAAMVNAIASGGIFRQPTLYAGQTDRFGRISVRAESRTGTVAISQKNAALLRSFMESGATDGTGRPGRPMYVQAAAKTATAQTGHFTNGKEDLISWYAGFFPVDSPKYVVVVMNEGGDSGGRTCGPVFKKIADSLYPNEIDKPAD